MIIAGMTLMYVHNNYISSYSYRWNVQCLYHHTNKFSLQSGGLKEATCILITAIRV